MFREFHEHYEKEVDLEKNTVYEDVNRIKNIDVLVSR